MLVDVKVPDNCDECYFKDFDRCTYHGETCPFVVGAEEAYDRCIEIFGKDHQIIIALEEISELTKEITKMFRDKANLEHMVEEMVDVTIVMEQIMRMLNISTDDFVTMKHKKLNRLKTRIENSEFK